MSLAQHPHVDTAEAERLYSKIGRRILPLLMAAYMIAHLDRINIGFAQLQMKQTLPFGDAVYGLGAGIFFVGYFLFEVPSNLMLERYGARKTLLRIMVLWGLTAAAMMFVTTPMQFYVMRFLLGAFEAGFFPGVILYLTFWFPPARRGRVIAMFMSATAIIAVVNGPLNGALMKHLDGVQGLHGWQWLFVVEGLPAVLLGFVVYFGLQDKPSDASWLTGDEKALLQRRLDEAGAAARHEGALRAMLRDPRVYLLSLAYLLALGAGYTMAFWTPSLIQSWGIKDLVTIGLLAAIPPTAGLIGMNLIGRHSDRTRERRWHFAACVTTAAVGLGLVTLMRGNTAASLAALALAVVGTASATPLFFTLVTEYLPPAAAACGIALISSLGNLGAAIGPSLNGYITQHTGQPVYAMYLVMAQYLAAGALLLLSTRSAARPAHAATPFAPGAPLRAANAVRPNP